jgi:hypothetical protein
MSRSRAAWTVWGVAIALLIAGVAMYVPNELATDGVFSPQMFLVPGFATVGVLVASRTGNRIGWLYLTLGLIAALTLFSAQLDERAQLAHWEDASFRPYAAWLGNWTWPLNYALLGMSLLLFPDGHLPSPRWLWAAWAFVVAWGLLILGTVFQDEQHTLGDGGAVANPFAVEGASRFLDVAAPLALPVALAGLAAAAAAPIVRYRRGDPETRQQVRWLAVTLAGCFAFVLVSLALNLVSVRAAETAMLVPMVGMTVGVPSAVGVAILRYRLYELDLIVNRTLVYAVLTGVLASAYLAIVVVLQSFSPVGTDSDLAVAGSTLAVAALFRPLRARIQTFIDRRFYRRRYDAGETLAEFSTRLRDQVDLGALTTELVQVVRSTMQPSHASLWIRPAWSRGDRR